MRLLRVLWSLSILAAPALSQERFVSYGNLTGRLRDLGLDGFATMLATYNPDLVEEINTRRDVTVFAPGNNAVEALLAENQKRDSRYKAKRPSNVAEQVCKTGPPPDKSRFPKGGKSKRELANAGARKLKRQIHEDFSSFPDSNFETLITFLDDPEYVNLGPGQVARLVKNQAFPLDGNPNSVSHVEITSGLGDVQPTLRGPFKFDNGVLYEVADFFTVPRPFTETIQEIGIAQKFFKKIKKAGKLHFVEETPAITIFVPIDQSHVKVPSHSHSQKKNSNIKSHIIHVPGEFSMFLTEELWPNTVLKTYTGEEISITKSWNGEILVNCRRLVRPNIITKNGVIHFIDGPLFGGPCENDSNYRIV